MDCFKKCLEINPNEYLCLRAIGKVYRRRGQWEEALDWYKRALKAQPEDAEACWAVGDLYVERREWDTVIEYFKMACDRAPGDPRYRYFLGWALAKKGDYAQALKECEKLKAMDHPKSADNVEALENAMRELRGE